MHAFLSTAQRAGKRARVARRAGCACVRVCMCTWSESLVAAHHQMRRSQLDSVVRHDPALVGRSLRGPTRCTLHLEPRWMPRHAQPPSSGVTTICAETPWMLCSSLTGPLGQRAHGMHEQERWNESGGSVEIAKWNAGLREECPIERSVLKIFGGCIACGGTIQDSRRAGWVQGQERGAIAVTERW